MSLSRDQDIALFTGIEGDSDETLKKVIERSDYVSQKQQGIILINFLYGVAFPHTLIYPEFRKKLLIRKFIEEIYTVSKSRNCHKICVTLPENHPYYNLNRNSSIKFGFLLEARLINHVKYCGEITNLLVFSKFI